MFTNKNNRHDKQKESQNQKKKKLILKAFIGNQLESATNTNYSKNINICSQKPRRKESTQNCSRYLEKEMELAERVQKK